MGVAMVVAKRVCHARTSRRSSGQETCWGSAQEMSRKGSFDQTNRYHYTENVH
jgi:hypothetical protein